MKNNIINSFFVLLYRELFPTNNHEKTLYTKQNFDDVIEYYLMDFCEVEWDYSHARVKITNKLPFFKKRFKKMKDCIENYRIIGVFVEYVE